MTDEKKVIQILEACIIDNCDECPDTFGNCEHNAMRGALELIKQLKAEKDDLLLIISGIMHFVDKWLEGEELEQDEVQRADTMREKTLKIVEWQRVKIEVLEEAKKQLENDVFNAEMNLDGILQELAAAKVEAIKEFKQKFIKILQAKADMAQGTPKTVFYSVIKMLEALPDGEAKT